MGFLGRFAIPLALVAVGCGSDGGTTPLDSGTTGGGGSGGSGGGGGGGTGSAGDFEERFLAVPVNEANPNGPTVDLRYTVVGDPSSQPVLVLHFGGPGVSTVQRLPLFIGSIPAAITDALLDAYALVGIDEIGVGGSEPLLCGSLAVSDFSESGLVTAGAAFANECQTDYALADELGTPRFARDLDRLREELEAAELSFLTYSYGTQVALTYAALFPDTTGRVVIDSSIDPRISLADRSVAQSASLTRALRAFFEFCDLGVECAFGNGNAEATFDLIYTRFSGPAELDDLVRLEATVAGALYFEPSWPSLGVYLQDLVLAPTVPGNAPDSESGPFFATTCTDFPVASLEEIRAADAAISANEIVFRRSLYAPLFPCLDWGTTTEPVAWNTLLPTIDDILIAGSVNDPITPDEFSDALDASMPNAFRVQIDDYSHAVGLFGEDDCFDDSILDFLLTGAAPQDCL